MSYLLDTNVVSEWTKPRPNEGLASWLADVDEDRTFLSVVTLGELRYGVDRLAAGARRARLERWLTTELLQRFEGRVLSVDRAVADRWGQLEARTRSRGRTIGAVDGFIASTALTYELALVTRNVDDFAAIGIELVNPWTDG